jgi:integrase
VDRRSCLRRHLIPTFGHLRIEQLTTQRIERWKSEFLIRTGQRRQAAKLVALLHSMYERAGVLYGLPRNPVAAVTRIKVNYDAARFDFYSPEEVWALVRAAASEQDGSIYLTAAFAGLRRGEIVALRWRDVDFTKRAIRVETRVVFGKVDATKGGRGRAVPMVREVGEALARLGRGGYLVDRDDPVFPGEGDWLDGSALRRRFVAACERAELRVLRFTTCAIRSGPTRSTGPISCGSRRGWGTPTTARRCGTCITRAWTRRLTCSPARSRSTRPARPNSSC